MQQLARMVHPIKLYKERTAHRSDTEHTQALLRVIILTSACFYVVYLKLSSDISTASLVVVFLSYIFSLLLLWHILRYPEVNVPRRILGLIHDPVITTSVFYLADAKMALYLFVYTWVSIGNGFRFGVRYLYPSAALGTLGIGLLLLFAPDWQANWYFGLGVLITNVAVTVYTGALLGELKATQAQLEKRATQDSLTGLANRHLLLERLRLAMTLNQRHSRSLAVLYFDLDDFKLVNDKYGHHVGDDLLRAVATSVGGVIRETDTFARFGGDEFVIVFDSLTKQVDSSVGANRVLKTLESITEISGYPVKISASIGLARLNGGENAHQILPETFIKAADDAMYKAKKSGKGRVEIADL